LAVLLIITDEILSLLISEEKFLPSIKFTFKSGKKSSVTRFCENSRPSLFDSHLTSELFIMVEEK
jgi:hypothetical protein